MTSWQGLIVVALFLLVNNFGIQIVASERSPPTPWRPKGPFGIHCPSSAPTPVPISESKHHKKAKSSKKAIKKHKTKRASTTSVDIKQPKPHKIVKRKISRQRHPRRDATNSIQQSRTGIKKTKRGISDGDTTRDSRPSNQDRESSQRPRTTTVQIATTTEKRLSGPARTKVQKKVKKNKKDPSKEIGSDMELENIMADKPTPETKTKMVKKKRTKKHCPNSVPEQASPLNTSPGNRTLVSPTETNDVEIEEQTKLPTNQKPALEIPVHFAISSNLGRNSSTPIYLTSADNPNENTDMVPEATNSMDPNSRMEFHENMEDVTTAESTIQRDGMLDVRIPNQSETTADGEVQDENNLYALPEGETGLLTSLMNAEFVAPSNDIVAIKGETNTNSTPFTATSPVEADVLINPTTSTSLKEKEETKTQNLEQPSSLSIDDEDTNESSQEGETDASTTFNSQTRKSEIDTEDETKEGTETEIDMGGEDNNALLERAAVPSFATTDSTLLDDTNVQIIEDGNVTHVAATLDDLKKEEKGDDGMDEATTRSSEIDCTDTEAREDNQSTTTSSLHSPEDPYLEPDVVQFIGQILNEEVDEVRAWTNDETSSGTDGSILSTSLNETRGGSLIVKNLTIINDDTNDPSLEVQKEQFSGRLVDDIELMENSDSGISRINDPKELTELHESSPSVEDEILLDRRALETCEDKSTDATVSIVTWNLAEESPSEEDAQFIRSFRKDLSTASEGSDIILISGQECENIKPRRTEGRRSREYRRLMVKMLGKDYVPIALHLLGGIQFGLFVKKSLLKDIEHISVADVTCGIGNVFHNKGAIAAFLQLKARNPPNDKTSRSKSLRMIFITAHMAAHVKNSDARDADFWRISSELEAQAPEGFVPTQRSESVSNDRSFLFDSVDRAFFCGDLNYRVDLPREITEYCILRGNKDIDWVDLLKHDQLFRTMTEGRAFPGFAEGKISFAPTFKFDKETSDYDTSHKQRIPAWTDRILFKPWGTRVVTYDSVPGAQHSDHRPVYGTFRVSMEGRELPPTNRRRGKETSRSGKTE